MKKQIFICVLLGLTGKNGFGMNHSLVARHTIKRAVEEGRYKNYCGDPTEDEEGLSCLQVCWNRSDEESATKSASPSYPCTAFWAAIKSLVKFFS